VAKSAFEINGENRATSGRTDSRRLRKAGKVPAIVYGGGEEPNGVVLDHNSLSHQMSREAFYTSILTLKVGSGSQQVIVKAVQRHPVRPLIMHLDLQRVREDEEVTLNVPIHFLNEANSKGVKEQAAVIDRLMTDAEVTCLPRYLPEYLEIDVVNMELNQIMRLSDIKLPEGVALVDLQHGLDHPVAACNLPRREEEDLPVEGAEAEVAAGEVPAVAQVEPAAGEAAPAAEEKEKDKEKEKEKKK
jgi:large subunit ribosomal protein L25